MFYPFKTIVMHILLSYISLLAEKSHKGESQSMLERPEARERERERGRERACEREGESSIYLNNYNPRTCLIFKSIFESIH
jgi:hypothetical protein